MPIKEVKHDTTGKPDLICKYNQDAWKPVPEGMLRRSPNSDKPDKTKDQMNYIHQKSFVDSDKLDPNLGGIRQVQAWLNKIFILLQTFAVTESLYF
jgi:hypothetical protein